MRLSIRTVDSHHGEAIAPLKAWLTNLMNNVHTPDARAGVPRTASTAALTARVRPIILISRVNADIPIASQVRRNCLPARRKR
jgi:hypothetical protein